MRPHNCALTKQQQEYVQARILQFARVYARHLPIPASMGSDEIDEAASLVYQALPPPLLNPPTPPSAENVRQLHLVLRHACRWGCLVDQIGQPFVFVLAMGLMGHSFAVKDTRMHIDTV